LIVTISKHLFSRTNSKAIALLVLLYALILGIFYTPFLLGQRCFYYTDATLFLEPHARFLSAELKQGQIPLWNPFNYCGMPQIAVTFPSLFYLPDWLLVLLPFSKGLAVSMIFHMTLAAGGFFLLAKSFKYKNPAAFTGALIFSLSGYMFCLSGNISLIAGLAWLPVALWALRELETKKARTDFWSLIRASISTLMLLLSGRPEIIGPSFLAILIYCGISAIRRGRISSKLQKTQASLETDIRFVDNSSRRQLRALFLAVSFSLPALLPVAEWLSLSRRSSGLESSEVFLYSAHWYDLLSMFFGPSLGDLRLHDAIFRPLVSFVNLPAYISCAYVGPVAVSLAVWGVSDKTWHWRWFTSLLLIMVLVASLGNYISPIPYLVHSFPILGFVRFPIKLLGFSVLLVGMMSAQGLTSFNALRVSMRSSCFFWLAILITGIVFQVLSANQYICLQFADADKPIWLMLKAQLLIGKSLAAAAGWGLGATLLAKLAIDRRISTSMGTSVLLLALVSTLLGNALEFERKGSSSEYWKLPSFTANAIKKFQKEDRSDLSSRVFNVAFERYTIPSNFLTQDQSTATVNEFQYHRQILKQNSNLDFFIPESFGFEGTACGDYYYTGLHSYLESSQSIRPEISPASDIPLAKFCAISSTNYLITQKYRKIGQRVPITLLDSRLFQLRLEDERMNVRIYKVLSSMPKLYITHNWRWIDKHNTLLTSIVSPTSKVLDPFAFTSIERVMNKLSPECHEITQGSSKSDELTVLANECNRTLVKVKTDRESYLVLSDQVYPGWHAYIDSQPTDIFVANGFTRAVSVPPGEHLVEFKYEPESLALGCILALLAALLALYLFLRERNS
jgi:hypothetical protein